MLNMYNPQKNCHADVFSSACIIRIVEFWVDMLNKYTHSSEKMKYSDIHNS